MNLEALKRRVDALSAMIPAVVAPPPDFLTEFWRMEDPVLGEIGPTGAPEILEGGMWDHQREWWEMENFIRLFVGGYGAGKTITCCRWTLSMALYNAGCPIAMVSPTFEMARETIVRTMEEILEEKEDEFDGRLKWRHLKNDKKFTVQFDNLRGTILYYSGENPKRLKGPNLCGAAIDEPFIQSYGVFQQLSARIRHPKAKKLGMGLFGTPEGLGGWGYELVEGEMRGKLDVGDVRAPTIANKALTPLYVESLTAQFDEKTAQAYLNGEFVNLTDGLVYYSFHPGCLADEDEVPPGAELGVGMDFNVDPLSCCVFWVNKDRTRMHVIWENESKNADTEFVMDEVTEKFPELREAYPDPTGKRRQTSSPGGKSDFYYIREAGLHVNARRPGLPHRRDRYNAVNGALKHGRLTVGPNCPKLKMYLSTYSYERMNKADNIAMSHLLDALGYPVEYLMPVEKVRTRVYDPDEFGLAEIFG